MSSPTLEELRDNTRFQLILVLGHREVAQFAGEYYWQKKSPLTFAHYLFSLGVLAAWIFLGVKDQLGFDVWMANFGFAVLAAVVLLPVHEWIHGVVYKAGGARDVRYKLAWRQLYAYAMAHNFVAGRRIFSWVAVTPFLVINTALVVASVVFIQQQFFLLGVLLIHTAGTSGDFAMLNFLWLNRAEEVYTYDDAEAKESYFYKRIEKTN